MGSERGWLASDWPSTGGVLNITAAAWTAGFHWWRSGNIMRTQNVSEYILMQSDAANDSWECKIHCVIYARSLTPELIALHTI